VFVRRRVAVPRMSLGVKFQPSRLNIKEVFSCVPTCHNVVR
jgi:hypothetical protein